MSLIQDIFEIKDRVDSKMNAPNLDLAFKGKEDQIAVDRSEDLSWETIPPIPYGSDRGGVKKVFKKVYLVVSNLGGSIAPRCQAKIQIRSNSGDDDRYKIGWLSQNLREENYPELIFDPVDINPADYRQMELFRFFKAAYLDNESTGRENEIRMPSTSEKVNIEPNSKYSFKIQVLSASGVADSVEFNLNWDGKFSDEAIRSAINFFE